MSEALKVYAAIGAVIRSFSRLGIGKRGRNETDGYAFRSIDDVCAALSPLLARHRLCILPQVLDRGSTQNNSATGIIFSVWVRAAFDIVSTVDGSMHRIETYGEAMDAGDKATAKAVTAAFKQAVLQTFCVPVAGDLDADRTSPPKLQAQETAPAEGWKQWAGEILTIVQSCQTNEALDRVQALHLQRLRLLSRTDHSLYAEIGSVIGERRAALQMSRRAA